MSNYTLTYSKDRSQEICIEKIGNGNNEPLYFNDEYKEARKLIKEIVDLQGTKNDLDEDRKKKKDKIKEYGCNNRILFTGQRGCGKTSVMRSLAEYLSSKDNEKNSPKDHEEKVYDVKFSCLPMVDPSHFDNNNNILLTVITSMFSEAKKKMEKNSDKDESAEREDLLKQFERVFKSLDSIKSELSSYTLESLNRKSDAEDLRDKMNTLVGKYLKYVVGDKEARLVLLIDDIDMSVSYAPEMLEQLRKYLELDNLIILMSANLGQLNNEMREKYSSAFQYTLKDSNQALSIDVEDLATKYLLKLFPTSRRINVERQVSQLLETDLKGVIEVNPTDKNNPQGNFQKVILSLIWSKTRLLFIPKDSENTLHPIIPTNLRDLAQFLDMLISLEKVESDYEYKNEKDDETIKKSRLFASKKDYDICEHNLQVFKNYFMKTWIPNHLNVGEELVFHNIPADITEINKHLVNSINIIGTNHKDDLMSREVSLDIIERNAENVYIDRDIYTMVSPNDPKFVKANKISDIFNQPSNYSYGDLLLIIDKYETYFESEEHRKFTDAIKIYYSILLFETMFFKSQDVKYNYEEEHEYEAIPIQRLIGGNVYYPNYFEIITDKNFNQKGPSYDAKRAFYHKVNVDGKKVGDDYPLFAVLYYGDIRPDRYEKDHIYDTTFEKNANVEGINYVTFDILSILNNMLNPCHTLSRLDEEHRDLNKWDGFVSGISEWGGKNIIDNNTSIPNAILPFYSVDMMLNYLRKDYRVSEICTPPDTKNAKKLADDYYFFFRIEHGDKAPIPESSQQTSTQEEIVNQTVKVSTSKRSEEKKDFINMVWNKIKESINCTENTSIKSFEELKKRLIATIPSQEGEKIDVLSDAMQIKQAIEELKRAIVSGKNNNIITQKINQIKNLDNQILDGTDDNVIICLKDSIKNCVSKLNNVKTNKSQKIREVLDGMIKEIQCINSVNMKQLEHFLMLDETKGKVLTDIASGKRGIINTLSVSDDVKESLKGMANNIATEQYSETLINNIITQEEFAEIDSLLKKYDNGKTFKKLLPKSAIPEHPIFTNENQVNTIVEYLKVIEEAKACYHVITNKCHDTCSGKMESITNLYKNRVIALVLGIEKQYMSKKDKETLVKEIHKYETVSEVYCHLVEVLWKNSITELCIRGVIQEKVRSIDTVQEYYRKLWDWTKYMLSSIDQSDSKSTIFVYEELFNEAEKIFIQ